jgi:outer membrane receptor protein involved in Fe transport
MHPFRLLPFILFISAAWLHAQDAASSETSPAAPTAPADKTPVELQKFVVSGRLDNARENIAPSLGATSFFIGPQQILDLPQGADAPFNEVLLRAPGIAGDSAANGDLHLRGEHANLQYRINDVLLPEGISGFGLELDPRFVNSLQLVTGSLPAQYGFRTAGVVDIQTKSGAFAPGGGVSLYGGSFDTLRPSFEAGGSSGRLSYFIDGSFDHNDLGIENPTASAHAIHDTTDQSRLFTYGSVILDDHSRLNVMASVSDSKFQVPNTPDLPAGTSPDGNPWVPGTFDSAKLDENQHEQNDYGVVTYQKSAGGLDGQLSVFGRSSSVHFLPDPVGDLYFNGVASDVARKLTSAGLQGDASFAWSDAHTWRAGVMLLNESVTADSATTVFPVDANGNATGPAFTLTDHSTLHGLFAGLYLQDEWKLTSRLTMNYGARFDVFNASFDRENQLSPRLNFLLKATDSTTLHAGYARYFTPPPVEDVPGSAVARFDGTSNAAPSDQDDPVKAERSNYFDAGVTQKFSGGFSVGLDGYYKRAKNQLDDGLFGQTLILSAFNYAQGEIYGVEFTSSYTRGGFSTYLNLAHSVAKGRDWASSQFLFDPADLAYVQDHWIFLDHDQSLTGSLGASYHWDTRHGGTRIYADVLYGSGLCTDATAPDGSNIPNGSNVPAYHTVNVGAEQSFKAGGSRLWKVRFDVVNLFDHVYELRDGSGVGVNAPQYGMRRGCFGSVGYAF